MSDKITDETPLSLGNWGHSPTAATVGNELYGPSGAMLYRVRMAGSAVGFVDVKAATGDAAAAEALTRYGGKVVHVEPAPQQVEA